MSVHKIKSLKLRRQNESSISLEDTSIILLEDSSTEKVDKSLRYQESSTVVHSTPKSSLLESSAIQEQAEYRTSPMLLPCTQDGGNEVAWDWQSPLTKSTERRKSRNNSEQISTPKRKTLLQKKRNSNSPLLYKPIKRKLMKNDNQRECFEIFTAEMKALSEQIKTVPKEDDSRFERIECENIEDGEDELLTEINVEDFDKSKIKPDPKSKESASSITKKAVISIGKTSLDDLFDDSIEDSMVRCSQEVEEKLKLDSRLGNSSKARSDTNNILKDFSWHQQSYTKFLATKEKSDNGSDVSASPRVHDGTNTQTKATSSSRLSTVTNMSGQTNKTTTTSSTISSSSIVPKNSRISTGKNTNPPKVSLPCRNNNINNNNKNNITASVLNAEKNVGASTRSEVFEIPDDSFDEDFLDVCFDDVENSSVNKMANESNQSSSRYGKFYVNPHANVSSDNGLRKVVGTAVTRTSLLPPPMQNMHNNCKLNTIQDSRKTYPHNSSNGNLEVNSNNSKSTKDSQSQSSLTSTTNSSRKFFKTKSLSTSNFDDHCSTDNRGKLSRSPVSQSNAVSSSVSKGWNSNINAKSTSVSTVQQQQAKTSSNSLSNNAWLKKQGEHNNGIKNFDRNATRDGGSNFKILSDNVQRLNCIKEVATGSQLTQICTPEEIERKRQEAKMKLEMKRKLQARSKSASLLPDFTTKKPPVKR